jgi:hypothetical protein
MSVVVRPPLEVEGSLVTHLDDRYRVELAHAGARFVADLTKAPGGLWLTITEHGSAYAYGPPRIGLDPLGRLVGPISGHVTPRYLTVASRALRALELDGIL